MYYVIVKKCKWICVGISKYIYANIYVEKHKDILLYIRRMYHNDKYYYNNGFIHIT